MGIFVQDSFTGGAGLLTAHAGEVGGWLDDTSGWNNYNAANAKLTGSGVLYAAVAGTDSKRATVLSNAVASQLDFYAELHINVGAQSSSSTSLKFYAHHEANLPSGTQYSDTASIFFSTSTVDVYSPTLYWSPSPYDTTLAAVADNSSHVVRIEYRYGIPSIKFFLDGALVAEWATGLNNLPTTPANFGFDIDSFNSPSGNGITVDYIELGTISPPTAFWTDLTGSLVETIGA